MPGYPVSLLALGEHDDDLDSELPHHAPEVLHRPGQRTLGRDVLPLFVETLTKHGINCYTQYSLKVVLKYKWL